MNERLALVAAAVLAARFHVTAATVLAWARRGWVPCVRAGHHPVLFDPLEVERALRARGKLPAAAIEAANRGGAAAQLLFPENPN